MSRRFSLALVALALAFGLLWRMPVTPEEKNLLLCENDSLFHLHRVQQCLEDYPVVRSVDFYSHYPDGFRVHWLATVTVLYATLFKAFPLGEPSLQVFLSWIPPLLGLGGILLAVALAVRLSSVTWVAPLVAFLCAFTAQTCRPFFYGVIDHHLFANLGVLVAVLGVVGRARTAWCIGLFLLAGLSPEGPFFAAILMIALFVSEIVVMGRGHCRPSSETALWYLAPGVICGVAVFLDRFFQSDPAPLVEITWIRLTLLQPLGLTTLGAVMASIIDGRARDRVAGNRFILTTALSAAAFVSSLFLIPPKDVWLLISRFGQGQRAVVDEEVSILAGGPAAFSGWTWVILVSGFFFAVRLARAFHERQSVGDTFAWTAVCALFALGMMELRHLYVGSTLLMAALGVVASESMREVGTILRAPRRGVQLVASASVIAVTAFAFLKANVIDRAGIHGPICGSHATLSELTRWLRSRKEGETRDRHPRYAVLGRWSIGHQLHVLGGQAVLTDPFNFAIEEKLATLWGSESSEALYEVLRRHHVRYLAFVDPVGDLRTVWRRERLPDDSFVRGLPDGQLTFEPGLFRFATFRLYMGAGTSPEFGGFRPRFMSREAHEFTRSSGGDVAPHYVPKGQIYELVPGATIHGRLPEGADDVEVRYSLARGDRELVDVSFRPPVEDRRFRLRTAMPAPGAGAGFAVTSGLRISAGGKTAEVRVTEDMVEGGASVEVTWAGDS